MKIYQLGWLVIAATLPAHASVIVPQSEWGGGNVSALVTLYAYFGPDGECNPTDGRSFCKINIASNLPPTGPDFFTGSGSAETRAYTDAAGAHVTTAATAQGESAADSAGAAGFYDTLINSTNNALQFQYDFHVDASLFALPNAVDTFEVDFYYDSGGIPLVVWDQTKLKGSGSGAYDTIDADLLTPVLTIAPHDSASWTILMKLDSGASSHQGVTYLAGNPTANGNAGNTLSMTNLSVFNADGSVADPLLLVSGSGFDYTSASSSAAAPEPSTAALAIGAGLLLIGVRRRRRSDELS